MRQKSGFFGKFLNREHGNIEVNVDVLEYEEDGMHYVYCPPLDLIGYGTTNQEARDSWEVVLEEYFKYTLNKRTLIKDLENRGWCVRRKNKQFKPPTFSWMLQHNDQLNDVYNNHNFHKTTRPISMPLQHAFA